MPPLATETSTRRQGQDVPTSLAHTDLAGLEPRDLVAWALHGFECHPHSQQIPKGGKAAVYVRRGKAFSSSGCEPRATTVAPVGSSQGGSWRQRNGLKHSGVKGPR